MMTTSPTSTEIQYYFSCQFYAGGHDDDLSMQNRTIQT